MAQSILIKPGWIAALTDVVAKLDYRELSIPEVVARLNAPIEAYKPGPVPVARLVEALLAQEKWGAVVKARASAVEVVSDAANGLCALIDSAASREVMVFATDAELAKTIGDLKAAHVLSDADELALRDACRVAAPAPSIGRQIGIGVICNAHVYQARNDGVPPPDMQDASWRKTLSAAGIERPAVGNILATTTVNAAASALSDQVVISTANSATYRCTVWIEVDGFAAAPAAGSYVAVAISPRQATGGTDFLSAPSRASFAVSADAQYRFAWDANVPVCDFYAVQFHNAADQNTDASAVDLWEQHEVVSV